jgi:hypothetical protein
MRSGSPVARVRKENARINRLVEAEFERIAKATLRG